MKVDRRVMNDRQFFYDFWTNSALNRKRVADLSYALRELQIDIKFCIFCGVRNFTLIFELNFELDKLGFTTIEEE
jgi:hypothetical protein